VAKKLPRRTMPPKRKSQYESAFSLGKAMSRAPIISGTTKFARPAKIGTTTRKTIVVPCMVKSSLYESLPTTSMSGCASCVRIRSAITPPARKNTRHVTT
jgi:hypothetical protein